MADVIDRLAPSDRRALKSLAEAAGISAEALIPEIVAGYLRLLADAPGALPKNPIAPLRAGALARGAA